MKEQACFDQSDVFAFLADPATHKLHEPIIRIDTHGAAVFLAGKNVYKVKRAVRFPFMDFSTLDKRRRACERELAVNKADAPGLYLGVVPISKDGSRLKFGPAGRSSNGRFICAALTKTARSTGSSSETSST